MVNMVSHGTGQSPLHLAVIEGHKEVVKVLVEQRESLLLRMTEEDAFNRTPVELARKSKIFYESHAAVDNWKEKFYDLRDIEMMLLADMDVQESIRKLNSERQDYVDAMNAILVGAALIPSVTYAGWLQPPLGLQKLQALNSTSFLSSDPGFAAVEFIFVRIFVVLNSLSFFFAIVTVVSGAGAVLKTAPAPGAFLLQMRLQRSRAAW
ncbi:hypothetical protein Mapa_016176 [Marchantia paleacea]|nr:hypothetical protein Mapa_016176 [Marchantia paleacea]